jgi:thiol-disulfide isomerase/thioredoxin
MAVPRMGFGLKALIANVLCLFAWAAASQQLPLDLAGKAVDPFAAGSKLTVLVFVRTDCPLSNRYAPEIQRLARQYASHGVNFWLVYPDNTEMPASIRNHLAAYGYTLPALRDAHHLLVHRAEATVTPEAAVFSGSKLLYHGRIDNRVQDFGRTRVVVTAHDLEDAIVAALDHKPSPTAIEAVGCYISDLQ